MATLGWAGFAATASATDARHYEKVSPADKGQGDIVSDGQTTIAAKNGDAVEFSSRTPFGDEVGSGVDGQTQYIARRTGDRWVTHAITPTPRPDAYETFFTATKIGTYSDDLTRAIVWGYDLPGGGGTPSRNNIYAEDTGTRALQALTLTQAAPLIPLEFINTTEWGTSRDVQHTALVTSTQLLPDATPGVSNVYQWDADKGLSLAGILPDGTVPSSGSDVQPNNYRAVMSTDGSRLVFTAAPNGNPELYMRIDGNMTVPISTPNGNADSTNVALQAVTPDGRNVFFVTDSPLVAGDTNGGPDLYRWTDNEDPAHDGTLTQISNRGELSLLGTTNGVIGMSDDGARVYYHTAGGQIVVWDNGITRGISDSAAVDPEPTRSLAAVASQPGFGRVTPDGMWLAFLTRATLGNDGIHAISPQHQITNGHFEMYLYSLRDDTLSCISCPSSGAAASDASIVPDATSGTPVAIYAALRPQFLSDSGQVFFSTTDALVPADVNGVEDVYEYDASSETLQLVSTGTGRDPTSFADAGVSGADVFVQTRQQLVVDDQDQLVDMYDATTRPALPAVHQVPASGCEGDTCQPPPSASPPEDLFGSVSLDGNGNSPSPGKLLAVPTSAVGRGAVVILRVTLFAPGRLAWQGRGVLTSGARHGRGALVVRVRLDRHARAELRKQGRIVTRVRLTLVLADGTRASGTARVTFRAEAKKGR